MDENTYKIESREELLDKINEEIEILESIFADEGLVLAKPTVVEASEADLSTNSSGKSIEDEEQLISQFAV
jgi:uncharacterized protein YqeY